MAQCQICGANPATGGAAVFRVNEVGQPGIWRCKDHLQATPVDEDVKNLVSIIEGDQAPSIPSGNGS